jgi:hypothetical protein
MLEKPLRFLNALAPLVVVTTADKVVEFNLLESVNSIKDFSYFYCAFCGSYLVFSVPTADIEYTTVTVKVHR